MPTTAEWELIAKSNQTKKDATKVSLFNQWVLNWVTKSNPKNLPAVGSTFKNFYGVYDIHGLVWEWTQDFNSALTTGENRAGASDEKIYFVAGVLI